MKDGIMDDNDKCTKEAERKNNYKDDDGCPDVAPAIAVPIRPWFTLFLQSC